MQPNSDILLVEDEFLIADLLDEVLTTAGFTVVSAADGNGAMEKLNSGAAKFRAVITDVRLGSGPDGWAIGRYARGCTSDMPIVYMTGDSGHEWSVQGVPGSVMVAKPFVPAQILTAVTTLLNDVDQHRARETGSERSGARREG